MELWWRIPHGKKLLNSGTHACERGKQTVKIETEEVKYLATALRCNAGKKECQNCEYRVNTDNCIGRMPEFLLLRAAFALECLDKERDQW